MEVCHRAVVYHEWVHHDRDVGLQDRAEGHDAWLQPVTAACSVGANCHGRRMRWSHEGITSLHHAASRFGGRGSVIVEWEREGRIISLVVGKGGQVVSGYRHGDAAPGASPCHTLSGYVG